MKVIAKALDDPNEEKKIQQLFKSYDKDNNGFLDIPEFERFTKDIENLMAKDMSYWNMSELGSQSPFRSF